MAAREYRQPAQIIKTVPVQQLPLLTAPKLLKPNPPLIPLPNKQPAPLPAPKPTQAPPHPLALPKQEQTKRTPLMARRAHLPQEVVRLWQYDFGCACGGVRAWAGLVGDWG